MSILDALAIKHDSDKSSKGHNYVRLYEKYFSSLKLLNIRLLEIGVSGGASMKMWLDYFPNARIVGVDIDPNCWKSSDPRCTIVIGNQEDEVFLEYLGNNYGPFDIIIDDGGHSMRQQQTSATVLFDFVTSGGLYIIEDLHTCFKPEPWWGNKDYKLTLKFLEERVQDLYFNGKNTDHHFSGDKKNHIALMNPKPELNKWEETLSFVHFYRCIVFMGKD